MGPSCSYDLNTEMDATDIKNALNANLPGDCNITLLEKVKIISILVSMQKKGIIDTNVILGIHYFSETSAGCFPN